MTTASATPREELGITHQLHILTTIDLALGGCGAGLVINNGKAIPVPVDPVQAALDARVAIDFGLQILFQLMDGPAGLALN